jgi:predicted DNA-binding mobile mystery protein A
MSAAAPYMTTPKQGWLKSLRVALGMTMKQLAERSEVKYQSVAAAEIAEAAGVVTLNTLKKQAAAMNARLVYAIVPNEGSIEKTLELRAKIIAQKILDTTSHTMVLENQSISKIEMEEQIRDLICDLMQAGSLWAQR